jgi:hypothetical protein
LNSNCALSNSAIHGRNVMLGSGDTELCKPPNQSYRSWGVLFGRHELMKLSCRVIYLVTVR